MSVCMVEQLIRRGRPIAQDKRILIVRQSHDSGQMRVVTGEPAGSRDKLLDRGQPNAVA